MSLHFNPRRGLIVVPTRIVGPYGLMIVRLALDTGATATAVSTEVLISLGYDPGAASEQVPITTGSGIEVAPRVVLNRIEALFQQRRTFPVLFHSLPPSDSVDGVLGLDFLRGRRLIVDLRAGAITRE